MPRYLAIAAFGLTLAVGAAHAYDSDLDPSFSDGTLTGWSKPYFDVGSYPSEHLAGLFRDADGGYLLVGKVCTSANCASFDIGIVRLLPDGGFDTSYGTNGYVRTAQNALGDIAAVARDSQGRFVVVGPTTAGATGDIDFGVYRLLADGRVDASFAVTPPPLGTGVGGYANIDFALGGGDNDVPADVVIDGTGPDTDSIVVVGSVQRSTLGYDVGIVKLTPAGHRDGTFGSGGLAHFNFGSDAAPLNSRASSIAMDNLGMLVIAGTAQQNLGNQQFALARYLRDGTGFDATFCFNGRCSGGNTGRTIIGVAHDTSRAFFDLNPCVALESGGNPYFGGTVLGYSPGSDDLDTDIFLMGFGSDGDPLPGYPARGFQAIAHASLNDLKVDPTPLSPSFGPGAHRLVFSGSAGDGDGNSRALVGRFIDYYDAQPDFLFAPGAHSYVALETPHYALETHLDGSFAKLLFDGPRIVLGGDTFYCCSDIGFTNYDFVAARLVNDYIFADGFELPP